jgi:hypothetical protein
MSELGHLLELIDDAHCRLGSLEAHYRDWRRPRPGLRITARRDDHGELIPSWLGAGPFPTATVSTRRICTERRDRVRVELQQADRVIWLGILDGCRWWRWNAIDGVMTSAGAQSNRPPRLPPLLTPPLIEPIRPLGSFRLRPCGQRERAGRKVPCARGSPRNTKLLPAFDDCELELELDAEHGTILRLAVFDAGTLVAQTEVLRICYDHDLDPRLFAFAAPDGSPPREWRSLDEMPQPTVDAERPQPDIGPARLTPVR